MLQRMLQQMPQNPFELTSDQSLNVAGERAFDVTGAQTHCKTTCSPRGPPTSGADEVAVAPATLQRTLPKTLDGPNAPVNAPESA